MIGDKTLPPLIDMLLSTDDMTVCVCVCVCVFVCYYMMLSTHDMTVCVCMCYWHATPPTI